jgi:hypothetical protein
MADEDDDEFNTISRHQSANDVGGSHGGSAQSNNKQVH